MTLLAQYGADVNDGLQAAVMHNQVDIVRLLLNHGAGPNQGVTLARTTYNEDMLIVLKEAELQSKGVHEQRHIQRTT